MAILGSLLKSGIKLGKTIEYNKVSSLTLQRRELNKLIKLAKDTEFGKKYGFISILKQFGILSRFNGSDPKAFYKQFKKNVPVYNYNKIHSEWWHRNLQGKSDVTWPGTVNYFALSSGTSEASTKHIPITSAMLKSIRKTSIRQILALANYDLPNELFSKGILMLGGSTDLNRHESYFEGDLSGITTGNIPIWFHRFYKPGRKIARNKDWNNKLDEIAENAHKWDIGFVAGVPAWIQIMMERIIERYKLNNIHEIWPNLQVFCHGGVSFEPYKIGFQKLLGRPIDYIETYLASEGFIAYQTHPRQIGMKMVLNNGLFYEFVPFNEHNFTSDGEIIEFPETLMIDEIKEGIDYALLLSTNAGTWRYLIGDTIRFINKEKAEIIITGRTKHFLSLCGEHLSVDNMNKAIKMLSTELNLPISEFTVAGIPYETMFAHKWYLAIDNDSLNEKEIAIKLDNFLKELNDDYRVERISALKEVIVEIKPSHLFYDWMRSRGKEGGQNKFPRVLKKNLQDDFDLFIQKNS